MKTKLFAKYSRITILVTIVIFLIASIAFYITLHYVQLNQVDEDLKIEEEEIVLYVKQYNELPKTFSVDDQLIEFTSTNEPFTKRYFNRTDLKDGKGHLEDFRQLIFGVQANGQWFKATVSKSLEETDHLVTAILWLTSSTILLILLASFIINRFVLKRLWKPFFTTLAAVKEFKVNRAQGLEFPATTTEEFGQMIDTLQQTTQQAQLEYLSLKTFSENASHEIQTPIAIIRSKLDLLIQDEQLTEKQSSTLQAIYAAIQRLTRLNSSLLLLAKIENKQYEAVETVDLKAKLEERLTDFAELWQAQEIQVTSSLKESSLSMNSELADILINNLLSNATRHNHEQGSIQVLLTDNTLTVSNTSKGSALDQTKLFARFYKPSQSKDDNGLGLSIIRQICEASGLIVHYAYANARHTFTIEKKRA
ncbi:MAG: histidine kinase [Flavisolibacter sp.]|jgi:signal transduction histidine kinase|nr:histidine kinase [Flavisolibacter sp.]